MANEAISWPSEPTLTDADDGVAYNMGIRFALLTTARNCTGVQWRVPDAIATPSGGTHAVAIWQMGTGTRIAYKEFTPAPGGYQNVLFDAPVALSVSPTLYVAVVYTQHYVFRNGGGVDVFSPSGNVAADQGLLVQYSGGAATAPIPTSGSNAWYYVSPLVDDGAAGATIAPDGIAVPVAAGSPTLAQSLTIAPEGIAVPAAAGSPTLAMLTQETIAPDGIAVPVAAGEPMLTFSETAPRVGSWDTLSGIVREARADHAKNQERLANPIDCPDHGWPLDIGPDGVRHCLFGGHVVV